MLFLLWDDSGLLGLDVLAPLWLQVSSHIGACAPQEIINDAGCPALAEEGLVHGDHDSNGGLLSQADGQI